MKKTLHILRWSLLTLIMASCLNDEISLNPDKSFNVIEFKNPSNFVSPLGSRYALYTQAFDLAPENDYPITVSYSGAAVAPSDITLTIGVDKQAVTQYNDEQKTDFTALPENMYTLPAQVVIPKGKRTATLSIKVKSEKFDFSKSYVLPVKILTASSGTISGNFGTILLGVNAKNKYDGNYTVEASAPMVDGLNPLLSGYYPLNSDLHTTGANSVVMFCNTYLEGLEGHPIKSENAETGAISNSYYGSFAPVFTMNETGKVVNVENFYGQPSANNRSARLDQTGVNQFKINADGSKTLEVSYVMVQAGADRTFFKEKWIFKGPR